MFSLPAVRKTLREHETPPLEAELLVESMGRRTAESRIQLYAGARCLLREVHYFLEQRTTHAAASVPAIDYQLVDMRDRTLQPTTCVPHCELAQSSAAQWWHQLHTTLERAAIERMWCWKRSMCRPLILPSFHYRATVAWKAPGIQA
jgi:hypothetical protein